ncbi:TetR/AcrR family transcriptional regulator [Euzebya tangerina]|uniref:TetR/AcrR family transcriptional regulator n=1 Tax=Euzebya tangerina TaxID=591198 RepID=UPI000E31BC94|nr:TetR/AcrR family transcriptional regulator [Euzebya tangerina]
MAVGPSDRAAAIRSAVRSLVADRGFHGASMNAIAKTAGVATGTAYTYYTGKDELLLAAYAEAKRDLGEAAVAAAAGTDGLRERFTALWLGAYRHLAEHPPVARFLVQVDSSPYRQQSDERVHADQGDPLVMELATSGLRDVFVELPDTVLYDLGLAPAVRLAASETSLTDAELQTVAVSCWRAVTGGAATSGAAGESAVTEDR